MYNREQPFRPMLVTFNSIEPKLTLFKNIHYIRKVKKYEEIRVSSDLTKEERENEKELWEEAKKLQDHERPGAFIYKVRVPAWARKIEKTKRLREGDGRHVNKVFKKVDYAHCSAHI